MDQVVSRHTLFHRTFEMVCKSKNVARMGAVELVELHVMY